MLVPPVDALYQLNVPDATALKFATVGLVILQKLCVASVVVGGVASVMLTVTAKRVELLHPPALFDA